MLRSHEEKVLNMLLNAVADRQQLLANNLTNVSTPGYIRKDLDFGSVIKDLNNQTYTGMDSEKIIEKATFEEHGVAPSYERELAEMAENHLKYILITKMNGDLYKHLEEATQSGRAA